MTKACFAKTLSGTLEPIDATAKDWEPVIGYEGLYEINRSGQVRSVTRDIATKGGWVQRHNGSMIKPRLLSRWGYMIIDLSKNGQKTTWRLHRLIAIQFIPNPDGKPHINHIDCDKTNNAIGNLEWCTNSENWHHAKANGKIPPCTIGKGEKSRANKLTNTKVIEIKRRLRAGEPARRLAEEYRVSHGTIDFIKAGKTWSHITL